jgi:hypothetical protein
MALRAPAARCATQLRASSTTAAAAAATPLAPPRTPHRRRRAAVAAPRAAFTPRGVAATDMPAAATGPMAAPSPLDALSSSLNALLSVAQSPVRAQYAAAQGVRAPACRHAHSLCAMCISTSSRRAAPFLRRAAAAARCCASRGACSQTLTTTDASRHARPFLQLRFAYFLVQGIVNSRVVLRSNLDPVAIARTVAKARTRATTRNDRTRFRGFTRRVSSRLTVQCPPRNRCSRPRRATSR